MRSFPFREWTGRSTILPARLRNEVGLLSEAYDVTSHRLVGNFPQAFSHVALVSTARMLAGSSGPVEPRAGRAASAT